MRKVDCMWMCIYIWMCMHMCLCMCTHVWMHRYIQWSRWPMTRNALLKSAWLLISCRLSLNVFLPTANICILFPSPRQGDPQCIQFEKMGKSCRYIFDELLFIRHLVKYLLDFRPPGSGRTLELFLHIERAKVVLKLILGATGHFSWGKPMQGEDICTLTFKGAYQSTNWVISGNIKALFLWDLKEKNVITSSTKHESFQYPSFLSPGNEKRFTLKRHFLWLHVLEPHKCKPSPPSFFWRKRGLQSFLLITVHLNKGIESHLFYQPHCLTCQ